MTFLNAAIAFGAIASSIPLIIHLLNRSRFDVVPWGAMHLLAPVIRVNRKRIRIEQWILLLMRMSLLALLALCMAGPVLTQWRALTGDAKSSLVLLFDNSYSMEAGGQADSTRKRALQQSSHLISRMPRGSELSIVLMAGGKITSSNAPSTDLSQAMDDLAHMPEGFGSSDVARAIERAAGMFKKMQNSKRDLIIVSDFQKSDWLGSSAPARDRALELINAMPLQPTISLLHAGSKPIENVCIRSLHISPPTIGRGQEIQVRANLRNYGAVPYPSLRVYLRIDGQDQDSTEIALGAGEDAQTLFRHTFGSAGSHVVEVFTDADALETDNRYVTAIMVWDSLPVLLVDGDPSDEPLRGETDFLEIALTPFNSTHIRPAGAAMGTMHDRDGTPKPSPTDLLQITSVTQDKLSAVALAGKRVLVLANVSQLSAEQLDAVQSFVGDGNALLIFPGGNSDIEWHNESLRAGGDALLPLEFAELCRSGHAVTIRDAKQSVPVQTGISTNSRPAAKEPTPAAGATSISDQQFDHPALELFNDPRNGALAGAEINVWYRLRTIPLEPQDSTVVLARLATGDPFLVEKSFRRGRVIQCAIACDDAWSNLPARPFYVPLMQRLVTYLASSVETPRNISVGETISSRLPDCAPGTTVTLTPPASKPIELPVQSSSYGTNNDTSQGIVEYSDTELPGVYTLARRGYEPLHFVVTCSRDESDLTQLEHDELQQLAESMGASVVRSAEEYLALDSTRRYGREIWRQLFWAMLALAFGELLVQQFFARSKL